MRKGQTVIKELKTYFMVVVCVLTTGLAQAGLVTNAEDFAQQTQSVTVTVEDVLKTLNDRGVASPNLQARLERMSPAELAQLHDEFEQLPAGAGVDTITGVLIGAALLVMSDYMGFTDIFPFIKADQAAKN